jgi:AraC-like DNA-binding protein
LRLLARNTRTGRAFDHGGEESTDASAEQMTNGLANTTPLKLTFSTDMVPKRDRLEHWRETVAKAIAKMDWLPLTEAEFHQEAIVRRVAELGIVEATHTTTGNQARRTPQLISTAGDDLVLQIQSTGVFELSQLGRRTQIGAGEAVLASSSDVATGMLKPHSQFLALSFPRRVLSSLVPHVERYVCVRLPRELEALRLLRAYLRAALDSNAFELPELGDRVVAHIFDLLALTFRTNSEALDVSQRQSVAAARLHSIKSDVISRLADADLTETAIAKRHRLTPRYLRTLFASEGTTFTDFLRYTRLTRAHQRLTDLRNCERTIASIAYEVGFGDLSYFNRLFRKQYGVRPSDVRGPRL